jgi:hypothetical protein
MTFIDMIQSKSDDLLLRLPFDQYGRYRMVQQAVDAIRQALGKDRLSILDVGGYYQEADGTPRLPSQQFLGDQDLTVLDLPPCPLPGYVQGDGTNMTFADSSFDLVISCDTLEHIPPDLRDRFIGELVRVARYGVVLICPIDDYRTALAEKVLYSYIHAELHARHDQLREHREYGLPQMPLVRRAFEQAGCALKDYPSGDLHAWLPMMLAKHYMLRFAESQPELQFGLDELYNRSYALRERREPSYRRLVVAAKQNENNWLTAVEDTLEPTVERTEELDPSIWHGLAAQVLSLLQIGQDDRREEWRAQMLQRYIEGQRNHVSNLDRIIADQQVHNAQLQQRVAAMQQRWDEREAQVAAHISDLEGRARWMEEQATSARQQLTTVQNGLIMRLLRRLGR